MSRSKSFKAYQTIIKMLSKRGYKSSEIPHYDSGEFDSIPRSELTFLVNPNPDSNKELDGPLYVFFPDEEKVGVKPIRTYRTTMTEEKIKHGIIIVKEGITSFANGEIQAASRLDEPLFLETFSENELVVDITEHELVPKHELLTTNDKNKLLETFSIKDIQLPKILSNDPISRYFGAKKGQVFKITRPSETAGTYISYRIVIGTI